MGKSYTGGKGSSGVHQFIINQMPRHDLYVEPFAGNAFIARKKKPADRNILIELDHDQVKKLRNDVIPGCEVLNYDGLIYLKTLAGKSNDNSRTVIYCDPPYMVHTRSSQRQLYAFDWHDGHHRQFLEHVKRLDACVMISHYPSDLYDQELSDWRREEYQSQTRHGLRDEVLYCNFERPGMLHEYTYAGLDYTDRQRIKRKVSRFLGKLERMSETDRNAILVAIAEKYSI